MATESHPVVLDRDFAKVGARDLINTAAPLLHELVNHATQAFVRCQKVTDALGGIDEDVAPFALYRIVTESTDAIEELIRESCCLGTLPILRTAFEAALSVEYINAEDSQRRGLAWFYVYVRNKRRLYRVLSGRFQQGQDYAKEWQREFGAAHVPPPQIDEAIANLDTLLKKPHLAPIATEYERVHRTNRKRHPYWHSLFGGPASLRELAIHMKRGTDYDFLYRYWSTVAHAHDVSGFLSSLSDGTPAFKSMRYAGDMFQVAQLAAHFQLRATLAMINRYRKGEPIREWYSKEVKPRMEELAMSEVKLDIIEHK